MWPYLHLGGMQRGRKVWVRKRIVSVGAIWFMARDHIIFELLVRILFQESVCNCHWLRPRMLVELILIIGSFLFVWQVSSCFAGCCIVLGLLGEGSGASYGVVDVSGWVIAHVLKGTYISISIFPKLFSRTTPRIIHIIDFFNLSASNEMLLLDASQSIFNLSNLCFQ